MPHRNISKLVVKRLPIYLRILDQLVQRDVELISSKELSNESGFTAEQIRKDLAYFGAFGTRGAGYDTVFLRDKIKKIIGLDTKTNAIVVGGGNLGTALTRYNAKRNPYVNIVAVFDSDKDLIGFEIDGIAIHSIDNMPAIVKKNNIKVAILAVPASVAQKTADLLVHSGIIAILNFAPFKLSVPDQVRVHNADLTIELQSLIYYSTTEEERLSKLNQDSGKAISPKKLKYD